MVSVIKSGSAPAPTGNVSAKVTHNDLWVPQSKVKQLVQDDDVGHRLKSAKIHLPNVWGVRQKVLAYLRDHVNNSIPSLYYKAVIGHDIHLSVFASLKMRQFHATQHDPFNPAVMGWWENIGVVSYKKVTVAFRDDIVDNLVAEQSAFGDYKFHESGLSNTAEANTHTALQTTNGITRATGTQLEGATADIYKSVGTQTADATETWEEHGIFNIATSGTMMDRNLISPNVSVVSGDQVEFTYEITFNEEA